MSKGPYRKHHLKWIDGKKIWMGWQRELGINPKAKGTNKRATGKNPRALGTNPRAVR